MTKRTLRELENILSGIKAAEHFIMRQDIEVCTTMLPHNLSFYNKDGQGLTPLTKGMGSDLVRLFTARKLLADLIQNERNPKAKAQQEW